VALAGLAFTAVAGFLHWITVGPNDVQPEDESEAQRLLNSAKGPLKETKGPR
jgi:formate dehydrogenase iron-sulfur subunit